VKSIEVGDPTLAAGFQGRLVRAADGTLYYAYFKYEGRDGSCDIAVFGGGSAPSPRYQPKVAVRAAGSTEWVVEAVPLANVPAAENQAFVAARFGLDAMADATGNLVLVFAGGGPGLATCGSSDLVVATRTAAGTWSFEVPVDGSGACCAVCEGPACCNDPACTTGSDAGAWAAVASTPEGLAVAYADYHYYWDEDGQNHQGLELWESATGVVSGIRPWSGLGAMTRLAYVDGDLVAAFTGFNGGGLHVARRRADAAAGAQWEAVDLRPGSGIGERPGLARAPDGHTALVYHAAADAAGRSVNDLVYCRSDDGGRTFHQPCENVDERLLHLGHNPSLAFDAAGRPVVSYYVCGASDTCAPGADGVRLAVRDERGRWWTFDVHFDASTRSGTFSQVVIDPATELPTVVFQDLTRGAAMVAQGRFVAP
jgi:hypothetical protein